MGRLQSMPKKHPESAAGAKRFALAVFTTLAVTLATATSAIAAPAGDDVETLQWISVEDYVNATGNLTEDAEPEVDGEPPNRFRIKLDDGSITAPLVKEDLAARDSKSTLLRKLDPGGGNDGVWWSVVWGGRDRDNTYVPLRLGNDDLGYRHYNVRHNLTSIEPWKAALKSHGPNAQGNYTALLVDSRLSIRETVVFGVQLATRTSDRRYTSPDGAYIGVITGYCKGKALCPAGVNQVRAN
jgi:hypothetical protein